MIECCFMIIFICALVAAMAIYYKETIILWRSTSETEDNLINLNGDGNQDLSLKVVDELLRFIDTGNAANSPKNTEFSKDNLVGPDESNFTIDVSNYSDSERFWLPYCKAGAVRHGKWREVRNRTVSLLCCAEFRKSTGYYLTRPGCSADGQMPKRATGAAGCDCKGTEHQYVWEPKTCKLHEWSATLLCNLLSNYQVVVIGDSVAQQTYATIMGMVETANDRECIRRFSYEPSDTLVGKQYGGRNRGERLDQIVSRHLNLSQSYNRSLLVLPSFGAHIVVPKDESIAIFAAVMNEATSFLNIHRVPYLWLLQLPAHPNCSRKLEPFDFNHSEAQILNFTYYNWDSRDIYKWRNFVFYPEIARTVVGEARLIDTFDPLLRRMDGHTTLDCIHWCVPGALEIIPIILNHMLVNDKELLQNNGSDAVGRVL